MHQASEEQRALVERALGFAREHANIPESGGDRTGIARRLYQAYAREGYHALQIPSEFGGSGLDSVSTGMVYEALGYGFPCTLQGPATTAHCIEMIKIGVRGERQSRLLTDIAGQGLAAGFCLTEEGAGSDIGSITTLARPVRDGFVITGGKAIVINHAIASWLIVFAASPTKTGRAGLNAFLVDASLPSVRIGTPYEPYPYAGSIMGEVVFDDVHVPKEALLGEADSGYFLLMETLDRGRPLVAAGCVGSAKRVFDLVLDYAKSRSQFGRPLFSFQGVSLPLAEYATRLQASRLLTFHALSRIDSGLTFSLEASMAKLNAAETLSDLAALGVEILGYRTVADSPVSREIVRIHRDAQLMKSIDGTPTVQKMVIASQL